MRGEVTERAVRFGSLFSQPVFKIVRRAGAGKERNAFRRFEKTIENLSTSRRSSRYSAFVSSRTKHENDHHLFCCLLLPGGSHSLERRWRRSLGKRGETGTLETLIVAHGEVVLDLDSAHGSAAQDGRTRRRCGFRRRRIRFSRCIVFEGRVRGARPGASRASFPRGGRPPPQLTAFWHRLVLENRRFRWRTYRARWPDGLRLFQDRRQFSRLRRPKLAVAPDCEQARADCRKVLRKIWDDRQRRVRWWDRCRSRRGCGRSK